MRVVLFGTVGQWFNHSSLWECKQINCTLIINVFQVAKLVFSSISCGLNLAWSSTDCLKDCTLHCFIHPVLFRPVEREWEHCRLWYHGIYVYTAGTLRDGHEELMTETGGGPLGLSVFLLRRWWWSTLVWCASVDWVTCTDNKPILHLLTHVQYPN